MEPNNTELPVQPDPVSRLPLVAMGALVVLAVLVALAIGLRGNASFPPGSPEDALQRFLQAGLDGDEAATVALVAADVRTACSDLANPQYGRGSRSGIAFEVDDVHVDGSEAVITAKMRYSDNGDPFDSASRGSTFRFELVQEGGEWFIHEAGWPSWIQRCLRNP